MKIGIISTVGGYSWAGSEEMWKLFALEALRAGHSVAVTAQTSIAESEELAEFRRLGGVIFPYQPLNRLTLRMAAKDLYSRFRGIRNWQPDRLCISAGGPAEFCQQPDLMAFLTGNKSPQVYILQANAEGLVQNGQQRDALRQLYLEAARIICVSRANANLLERQLASALPNTVILPNPIRSRLNQRLPWPEDLNGEVRFATVARYDIWCKCQDLTLEAFAAPEWKNRNWQLNLFGSGPDESYLKDLIRHYGLESKVTIRGYERDFKKIWADQHLHILNSRQEGLPLALIESMFCGRPAVVTRVGGNDELVRDEMDGFVSPGVNSDIIRETLERAWTNRDRWPAMGTAAFQRAEGWVPADLSAQLLNAVAEAGKP
jgi:glycosyltransferase involved in cell wall biosynthesis